MKVLITGAGGQIGSALAATAPSADQIAACTHGDLDISDADAVADAVAELGPDLIVNAAAFTAVDLAENEPEAARRINEIGAGHLAESAAARGARMIQLSTDFIFDGNASTPYAPDAEPNPLSVYGRTKLAGERAVLAALPGAVLLRTAWVYAARGRNFVLTMLRLMREGQPVRVVADQIGTPTAAESVASAVWALAAADGTTGIFHWTDAGVASWYDLAVAVSEEASAMGILDRPVEVVPIATAEYPTPAQRPRFSVLDTRSTVAATGLAPRHWRVRLRQVLGDVERV